MTQEERKQLKKVKRDYKAAIGSQRFKHGRNNLITDILSFPLEVLRFNVIFKQDKKLNDICLN